MVRFAICSAAPGIFADHCAHDGSVRNTDSYRADPGQAQPIDLKPGGRGDHGAVNECGKPDARNLHFLFDEGE